MTKRKGRTFPYFDVDMNGITKTSKTITIVDRNTIQLTEEGSDGKPIRVFNPDTDVHIIKEITIPASSAADRKQLIEWMLAIQDPRYTIVYDHRRNSFHVEYATDVWLDYLSSVYDEEDEEEVEEEIELEAEDLDEDLDEDDE